jgi:SAM-dependent methyltransferase
MKNRIEFLDLGLQPLANSYLKKYQLKKKEKNYRLKVCFDKNTKLVSIKKKFSSQVMFDNEYPYRSSMSKTMINSFKKLAQNIKHRYRPKKILEIGSNDGSFLKNFNKKKTIGVEPCTNIEKITKKLKFNTIGKYWDTKLAKYILKKFNKVDVVYSANTLTHIKNLDDVFKAINIVLSDDGVLIIEDPSLLECLKKNTYDQFYNEHIYVFSYTSLKILLKKYKLEIFRIETLDVHGGSNRYFIKKDISKRKIDISVKRNKQLEKRYGLGFSATYIKFAKRVKKSKKKLKYIFKKCKQNNKKIIGYGATAKSTTILNYCNIDDKTIDYFVDTTEAKQNKYTPGTKIFIKKYKGYIDKDVDYIFLGAWNFQKEIFAKEKKFIRDGGRFIIHTPYPKII